MPATITVRWCRIGIENRFFVYGPRLGALYLLPAGEAHNNKLIRVLGVRSSDFEQVVADPASVVLHDITAFKAGVIPPAPKFWCYLYRFIHQSRNVVPFGILLRLATNLVSLSPGKTNFRTQEAIGKLLHAIETKIALRDCYPRAIITACLCSKARLSWQVAIGILSPTRMMHAWCSTNGVLPYEPLPEHYMYQPLIVYSRKYS